MKIGIFSDPHLRDAVPGTSSVEQRKSRWMEEAIRRSLEFFIENKADLLIVPGDIIDDCSHPAAEEDLKMVHRMIKGSGIPAIVVAGNHDPAPDKFYEVFNRSEKSIKAGNCEFISFSEDACKEGELASERSASALEEMRNMLSKNPAGVKHTIIIQHYLIFPERNEGYPHNYANDAAIREIMEGSPRRIFSISGHFHPGVPAANQNGVAYFCAGALCENPFPRYILDTGGEEITMKEETFGGDLADKAR